MSDIPTGTCQSTELGKRVQIALSGWQIDTAATPEQIETQEEICFNRVKAAEEAASWARPDSAGGALVHLLLAASDVEDLPRVNPVYLDRTERTVCRNLYAVRDFLLRQISDAERSALHKLIETYMREDPHTVNPLLDSGRAGLTAENAGVRSM